MTQHDVQIFRVDINIHLLYNKPTSSIVAYYYVYYVY